jgi:hypothetical protein
MSGPSKSLLMRVKNHFFFVYNTDHVAELMKQLAGRHRNIDFVFSL